MNITPPRLLALLAATSLGLSGLAGCKDDKRTEDPSKDEQAKAAGQAEKDDGSEAPASNTDALWKHAPPDAVLGIVIGKGALSRGFGAFEEGMRIVSSIPKGRELIAEMRKEVSADAPFDVTDRDAYATVGLDLARETAIFVDKNDQVAAIFPVTDRAAFRKLVEAKTETVDGVEVDRIGDDGKCIHDQDLYVCADTVEMARAVIDGKGSGGALPSRALKLPAELRGDIEAVALFDQIPDAKRELADLAPVLTDIQTGVASVRIANGRLTARAWLQGKPAEAVAKNLKSLPFDDDLRQAGAGAVTAYSARIPLEATGILNQLPPSMPAGPFDFRKAFVDQLTGEIAIYTVGSDSPLGFALIIAAGMKDTEQLANAIGALCGMAASQPFLKLEGKTGSCVGTIDPSGIPSPEARKMLPGPVPVSLTTGDDHVIAAFGGSPRTGKLSEQASSAATRSMLEDEWNAVFWGRYADPFASEASGFEKMMDQSLAGAPAQVSDAMAIGRLLMAHLYESGIAARMGDDGMHLVLQTTTMAADPPEVYAAYSKAVAEGLAKDGNYAEALGSLATAHPSSLAAKQSQMVTAGAPSLAASFGLVAALAVPAFMKYIERSKAAGARFQDPATAPLKPVPARKK